MGYSSCKERKIIMKTKNKKSTNNKAFVKTDNKAVWFTTGVLACLMVIASIINTYVVPNGLKRHFDTRARITDRNGVVLADNLIFNKVRFYPKKVKQKDIGAVAQVIHEVFPTNYSIADALKLVQSDKKGILITPKASKEQTRLIKEADKEYGCFEIEPRPIRIYPQSETFAHLIGFTGNDNNGLEGAEIVYNEYLESNSDPLKLSVDSRIQNIFHEQLVNAVSKYKAKGAMGMLMNSKTGEMIAMVQLPDFDPNDIASAPVVNRRFKLLRDVFEMGSVFKLFNTALAYENGLDNKEYRIDEPLMVYDKFGRPVLRKPIDDILSFKRSVIKKQGLKTLKAPDIMLYSSNVGSARMALDLPAGAQEEFFQRLHLTKPLDLEFGRTEYSLMPRKWGTLDRATISFGHGMAVTPMHLLLAVNSIINDGIYVYPTLLKDKKIVRNNERVLDSNISAKLREIMFNITEQTTARKAKVKGIEIGGTTGTVEKRAGSGKNITIFTGFFPVIAPKYTMLVILDEPQSTPESSGLKTSAWNVVPTSGQIISQILPILTESK